MESVAVINSDTSLTCPIPVGSTIFPDLTTPYYNIGTLTLLDRSACATRSFINNTVVSNVITAVPHVIQLSTPLQVSTNYGRFSEFRFDNTGASEQCVDIVLSRDTAANREQVTPLDLIPIECPLMPLVLLI